MNRSVLMLILLVAFMAGCQHHVDPSFADKVFEAHGGDNWKRANGMAFDLHIESVGRPSFDAHITNDINSNRARMQLGDDTILVFDGHTVWVSPPTATVADSRNLVLNWPFLITLPLRLKDPGLVIGPPGRRMLGQKEYLAADITPQPAVRENANDHYTIYVDPSTFHLQGLVVYPKGPDPKPYAITVYGYRTEDGITLASNWFIWRYKTDSGIHDRPISGVKVYNLEVLTPYKTTFTPPAGARAEK